MRVTLDVQDDEGLVVGMRGMCRRGTDREGANLQLGEKARKGLSGDSDGGAVWRVHGRGEGSQEVFSVQKQRGRVKQKWLLGRKVFEPRGRRRSKSEAEEDLQVSGLC